MLCEFDPDGNETGARDNRARIAEAPGSPSDRLANLNFKWRAHEFNAVLVRGKNHTCDLTVTSDLGPMPYSLEGTLRRINIFAVLHATRGGYPVQVALSKKNKLNLTATASLPSPVTAKTVIAGVTAMLVQARPYLDMIDIMQPDRASVRFRQREHLPRIDQVGVDNL